VKLCVLPNGTSSQLEGWKLSSKVGSLARSVIRFGTASWKSSSSLRYTISFRVEFAALYIRDEHDREFGDSLFSLLKVKFRPLDERRKTSETIEHILFLGKTDHEESGRSTYDTIRHLGTNPPTTLRYFVAHIIIRWDARRVLVGYAHEIEGH